MSEILQKSLYAIIATTVFFIGYFLWNPGFFGMCQESVLVTHWLFGEVQRCVVFSPTELHNYGGVATNVGFVMLLSAFASLFLQRRAFTFFRNWFAVSLLLVLGFIYLLPDIQTFPGAYFEITDRTQWGAILLALSSIVGIGVAYWRGKKRNAQISTEA